MHWYSKISTDYLAKKQQTKKNLSKNGEISKRIKKRIWESKNKRRKERKWEPEKKERRKGRREKKKKERRWAGGRWAEAELRPWGLGPSISVREWRHCVRHSGRVSHRGKDLDEREKESENHTRGVPGGPAEVHRAEEKRTVPLVRAGRWRLGHAQ